MVLRDIPLILIKTSAFTCFILVLLCLGCSETGVEIDSLPPLPVAISELPVGILIEPERSIAEAQRMEEGSSRLSSLPNPVYLWPHPLTISAFNAEVQILEYGVYVWADGQWLDATEELKPYTPEAFSDVFQCLGARLKVAESYTSDHFSTQSNMPRDLPVIYRWYFIGQTAQGRCRGEVTLVDQPPQD